MNISKIKYYCALIAFLFYSSGFSQFNTLTPMLPKKMENQKILENTKEVEENNPKQKKDKKSWKQILNLTTKSNLNNEIESSTKWLTSQIDSLKNQMLKLSVIKNEKKNFDFRKIEDSLIKMLKENTRNLGNSRKSIRQLEFMEDQNSGNDLVSKINMPLKSRMTVTSPFGNRIHPIFGTRKLHNGTDFKANYENVYAVLDGTVIEAGWDSKGGGNYIKVKHFNRFETAYLHLSEIYYQVGEHVKAGFIIGKSGNSGNSTGPHLHFMVKEYGKIINPAHFLNDLIKVNNLIATYYEQ